MVKQPINFKPGNFLPRKPILFKKGFFKILLLYYLNEKPMHGYEIINKIRKEFLGFYAPSPGVVYPTLFYLEDLGYVYHEKEDGRKIYHLTEKGKKFLSTKEAQIKFFLKKKEEIKKFVCKGFFKKLFEIFKLLTLHYQEISERKASEIVKVIEDSHSKIQEIIFKGEQ